MNYRQITAVILIGISGKSYSGDLILNNNTSPISEHPITIDCNGVNINMSGTSECCIGNSCDYNDTITLNRNSGGGKCPKMVVDGMFYNTTTNITIYTSLNYLEIDAGELNNCAQGNGTPPSIGSGYLLVGGSAIIGVDEMFLDVNDWTFNVKSLDGDVTCTGGTPYINDVIYFSGF